MSIANGGFPPISYCQDIANIKKDTKDLKDKKKERAFAPDTTSNINIRQILKDTVVEPMINLQQKDETLELIDTI
jgi:hypothetical protein